MTLPRSNTGPTNLPDTKPEVHGASTINLQIAAVLNAALNLRARGRIIAYVSCAAPG